MTIRLKPFVAFALHTIVALVISTFLGGVITVGVGPWFGDSQNVLLSPPYAPLLWSPALLVGFLLNRALRNNSAKWVWIMGLLWLISRIFITLRWYNPRWCHGCSAPQFIWYSYFSYRDCMQECLGQLFGTTPMLSSVAYSIGAMLGLKSGRHASPQLAANPAREHS